MRELFAQWRELAKEADPTYASALKHCADQAEKAYHEECHDSAWDTDCPLCMKEMAAEDFVAPKDRAEAELRLQDLLLRNGAQIREPTL